MWNSKESNAAKMTGVVVFFLTFFGLLFVGSGLPLFSLARAQLASLFFADDLTPQEIQERYWGKELTVLIVPGHDNVDGGTSYKGVYEAEYTAKIGEYLYDYLKQNAHIKPILVRNRNGYVKEFADYFAREEPAIRNFITQARGRFQNLSSSGAVETLPPPIAHIRASSRTTKVLYGINKWANERDVDIVIHIHLNDYPRKAWNTQYDGFSIYIPDPAFPNYAASRGIAESLKNTFAKYWAESNLRLEEGTIIEDPDLIALGSYGTLRAASVLLEYGYIYEPRFQTELLLKEAAFRTYQGLLPYFGDTVVKDEFAWLLPYEWEKTVRYGALKNNDVAAFQSALLKLGFYPPSGSTFRDCPVSGNFKDCTQKALGAFQDAHGIVDEAGVLGYKTRQTLNTLF